MVTVGFPIIIVLFGAVMFLFLNFIWVSLVSNEYVQAQTVV
jgi:hypothetical protein